MLFDYAHVTAGQTVLIHGAAGNVGAYAVQLAKQAGLHVVATAAAADLDYVRGLGAERVLDYKREGLWGVYGQPNVSWGNYARFVDYTAELNWFLPAAMIPALAIIATAAETLLGLLLVLGWKTRITALLSGVLLTTFALTMTMALGVKAPLNFSVFSAAGGALFLGVCANFPFSLDELLRRNS
jgi:uncharacterized membrane protein YphA (DoxX/SURF4 family)